ncbi:hypothetical protein OG2516_13871 [Oceanicola granulosus HTCC2516]|uniref:Uncharacterized protein n=1 Tax=Oceanicola granulosus (strain ATCC BAA-861 / DSM 15982 / KCTC 12143 / HTCC2516) TaxID=314256 RepID=Q2CA65_OCEGH|nr:hypothetical protein [Oceanicola granulosus]EAR49580.1 hypothetical protein OG2516_13871 [Oceanicola granulosus HTCC2516]
MTRQSPSPRHAQPRPQPAPVTRQPGSRGPATFRFTDFAAL